MSEDQSDHINHKKISNAYPKQISDGVNSKKRISI